MRTAAQRISSLFAGGRVLVLAAMTVALTLLVFCGSALASSAPVVVWTNAWNLTPNDATVGAEINPEGLPHGVYYQFQVVANTSEYLPEIACSENEIEPLEVDGCMGSRVPYALPIREVSGTTGKFVSLDLEKAGMTLKPGMTYHYRVLAVKALESEDTLRWEPPAVVAPDQTFTTPLASTPAVESEADSHVTSTGATLEAKISSEDLPEGVYYQFQLVKSPSEYLPELTCPEPEVLPPSRPDDCNSPDSQPPTPGALPIGYIAKGPEGQSVSLDLAAAGVNLQPSTTYHYRVLAAKRVQSEDGVDWQSPFIEGPDRTFTTPPAGTTPTAPVIESVSASNLTSTDATLEAKIDTEGLATLYQFTLRINLCPYSECVGYKDIPLPSGLLLGSFVSQAVSLDLNSVGASLAPGVYEYALSATSAGGHVESQWQTLIPAVLDPPTPVLLPLSGGGQPPASGNGEQSAGSEGSTSTSSSVPSTPGVGVLGAQTGKTSTPKPLTRAQKLAGALKACTKKPKRKRAACESQARRLYGPPSKHVR